MKITMDDFNQLTGGEQKEFLSNFHPDGIDFIGSILKRLEQVQLSGLSTLRKYTQAIRALVAIEALSHKSVGVDLRGKLENINRFANAAVLMEDYENYEEWKKQIDHICDSIDEFRKKR